MAKTTTYTKWSADEVAFLHENYGKLTGEAIAAALERTEQSVWEKAGREKLRKHAKRHQRTPDGPWHCSKCNKDKPVEEFGKSGSGRGSAYCTICTNRSQQERRNDRKH